MRSRVIAMGMTCSGHGVPGRGFRLLALVLVLVAMPFVFAGEATVRKLSQEEAGYEPYLRYAPASTRLDWLLVTTRDLAPAFAPLVQHRRDLGLTAEIVHVEDVRRDVLLGGGDLPERLRNLVRRLHRLHGLRYVVLAADSNLLPSRMVPMGMKGSKVHHGELFAGDAYFGCLDEEWNSDADGRFGESEAGNDDRPDVVHEVHVGRIPVESTREVEAFVAKLLLHERPVHRDFQDRVVYLGGKVFVEGDADRFYRSLYEEFFEARGFNPQYFTLESEGKGAAAVLKTLSEGAGVVCHYHHSFTYNMSLPHGAIDTGNVGEITNRERPFIVFSNGCYANQFTKEGISEKLLLSPVGGAVAFIGSTNTCFSSSLRLEHAFWEILFGGRAESLGEALSFVRGDLKSHFAVTGFLRLAFNLVGDPATRLWLGRPETVEIRAKVQSSGALRVTRAGPDTEAGDVYVSVHQEGAWGLRHAATRLVAGVDGLLLPARVGNGGPLRVTAFGDRIVPQTIEVPDPSSIRTKGVRVGDGAVHVTLDGADDLEVPLPADLEEGSFVIERDLDGRVLRLELPVLAGQDEGFVRGEEALHFPGFGRMLTERPTGLPLIVSGDPRLVRSEDDGVLPPLGGLPVTVESTHRSIRLGWDGEPGARWVVERETSGARRILTPVPLVNPVFEWTGLEPLSKMRLVVSRLDRTGERVVDASTTFAFQRGFPQRIGANTTSVQLLDLDGRRGREVLFGDDKLGLWALRPDGSEVRHAGDNWTFGLFAAIESGVFEPVVANIVGSKKPEILATSKLKDRKLYAFHHDGKPVEGFPVSFRARLMTPPLVGDFDGKRGNEILVVSGFGKTIHLVKPDGTKEKYAEVGQYNYPYPIAVNLDRDRALELVLLDGAGALWSFDAGGMPREGFPVQLGGPGRATPMVANLDRDRSLEIVAVGKGTTRLVVVDAKSGEVQADLAIPDAGKPANHSFFYPGLARLAAKGLPSIIVGTPSKKLFAFDLVDGKDLVVRDGFPLDLPAEARGVAAVDVDGDGRDELFLSLHDGAVWGLSPDGDVLDGFPLTTGADTYAVPLLDDLDGDGDLELFLGAADGVLRVWDLPYRPGRKKPTWPGLLGGSGLPGVPGR